MRGRGRTPTRTALCWSAAPRGGVHGELGVPAEGAWLCRGSWGSQRGGRPSWRWSEGPGVRKERVKSPGVGRSSGRPRATRGLCGLGPRGTGSPPPPGSHGLQRSHRGKRVAGRWGRHPGRSCRAGTDHMESSSEPRPPRPARRDKRQRVFHETCLVFVALTATRQRNLSVHKA